MPCPYFEPQRVVAQPSHAHARLPLIDEYDGLCRVAPEASAVPEELRFRCCNQGNSRGQCESFPHNALRSSLRYEVVKRSGDALEVLQLDVLQIEERDYAPVEWRRIQFLPESDRLEPSVEDACARAQLLAFCRSYLRRYRGPAL
jgi:hypothetical protein